MQIWAVAAALPDDILDLVEQLRQKFGPAQRLDLAEELLNELFSDPELREMADAELLTVIDLCLDALDDHRFRKPEPGFELRSHRAVRDAARWN
jgi:hypothetical protein